MYKYVYKGYDNASVEITNRNDEIKMHVDTRYVSAIESFWRIDELELNDNNPAVYRLAIHEKDQQNVVFDSSNNQTIDNNIDTTLTSWMKYNESNDKENGDRNCLTILYPDFPKYYTYDKSSKKWKKRKNNQRFPTIGRVYTVSPHQKEKFYLRLLLFQIPGAKSFEDLKTVESVVHPTYESAAEALGLTQNDSEWENCLAEANQFRKPKQMRLLFSIILVFCSPASPHELWTKYEDNLIEDFIFSGSNREQSFQLALKEINSNLIIHSKQLKDFPTMPQIDESIRTDQEPRIIRDELFTDFEMSIMEIEALNLKTSMNPSQNAICEQIINAFHNDSYEPRQYFIDGPGGTGKTFIYNFLLKYIRGKGEIALAVASSGIAAVLLPNGRTAHSRFGIPLDIITFRNSFFFFLFSFFFLNVSHCKLS